MVELFMNCLTAILEAIMFFLLFEAFFYRKDNFSSKIYWCGIFTLAVSIIISNSLFQYKFGNAIMMILAATVFAMVFYKARIIQALMASALGVLIFGTLEVVALFLITNLFSVDVDVVVHIWEYRFLGVIISKLSALSVCNAIRIKRKWRETALGKTYWILFTVLFLSTSVAVFLIFKMTYEIKTMEYNNMAILAALGLFFR